MLNVQDSGLFSPNSTVLAALNAALLIHGSDGLLRLSRCQLSEHNPDRRPWLDLSIDTSIDGAIVHGSRIVLSTALADVSETIGKHVGGQLSNPEFPDLLPASWECRQPTFVADADEPVTFEALLVHPFAVVEHCNCRILIVHARREEYMDS